jgi:alkylation response protein AidB-like acyl-CoA dehydrogenase
MDFSWSKEQHAFRDAVVKFAQNELNEGLIDRERSGELARENWRKCADFGLIGLATPEEYGGAGEDILTTMLVMEGLGYGCKDNGLAFAINAQMWSVQHPIIQFGTGGVRRTPWPPAPA